MKGSKSASQLIRMSSFRLDPTHSPSFSLATSVNSLDIKLLVNGSRGGKKRRKRKKRRRKKEEEEKEDEEDEDEEEEDPTDTIPSLSAMSKAIARGRESRSVRWHY